MKFFLSNNQNIKCMIKYIINIKFTLIVKKFNFFENEQSVLLVFLQI